MPEFGDTRCIVTTDRHTQCKGKAATPGGFCKRHTAPPPRCDGTGICPAPLHIHGCYTDRDGSACDDPADHSEVSTPPAGGEDRG